MQYTKNIYQSRPPLHHTPHKTNNFNAEKQQNFVLKSRHRQEDTDFTDAYVDLQFRRRNSRSCKKNIYQNQNVQNSRRPKQYCPLSKTKTSIVEEVLKKSREYIHSYQFNNYVNAVKSSSKNREDLIENMKRARTNNIYLPISQQDMHRPTFVPKCNERKPIFTKNNNHQNGDLFASFQLTIDHLSKIEEKEAEIIQRNNFLVNQQKENAYRAANINNKSNEHAILIKDEADDQYINRLSNKQIRQKTPLQRSPIFPAYNRPTDDILKIHEQNSMTKRKKTTIYTPTKSYVNADSSAKFVDYEEVDWLKKRQRTENRTSKSKYQYLAKQNDKYLVQNQRLYKKSDKKTTINKITQSSFSSTALQNSLPTAKASSIYDVDFKLQRPTGNSISQINFKKQQDIVFGQTIKAYKRQVGQGNKQNRSYSRSHSKGKLSVITTSKCAHFH